MWWEKEKIMNIIKFVKYAAFLGAATVVFNSHAGFTGIAALNSGNGNADGNLVFSSGGTSGGTFSITGGAPPTSSSGEFRFTSSSGTLSGMTGLYGSILNPGSGSWSYGPIVSGGGGVETASVNGAGTLEISDGTGLLSGTVNWMSLSSLSANNQLNTTLSVNIGTLTYSGSNAGLLNLLNIGNATGAGITLQFVTGSDLYSLAANGATAGFTGLVAVPETTSLVAGALLLLPFGASTIRFVRKSGYV